jgi:hypothetical protein
MDERNGKESSQVTLYRLFAHFRRLKEWLDRRDIPYESVNVDLLVGEGRFKVLKNLVAPEPGSELPDARDGRSRHRGLQAGRSGKHLEGT